MCSTVYQFNLNTFIFRNFNSRNEVTVPSNEYGLFYALFSRQKN